MSVVLRAWKGLAVEAASQGVGQELPELPPGFLTFPLLGTSRVPSSCNCHHFSRQNRDGYFASFPQEPFFFLPTKNRENRHDDLKNE